MGRGLPLCAERNLSVSAGDYGSQDVRELACWRVGWRGSGEAERTGFLALRHSPEA